MLLSRGSSVLLRVSYHRTRVRETEVFSQRQPEFVPVVIPHLGAKYLKHDTNPRYKVEGYRKQKNSQFLFIIVIGK